MIIVLKPHTSEENITRVENLVKNRGLDTHVVRGTEMTIIGCIGDTTLIDPRLFEGGEVLLGDLGDRDGADIHLLARDELQQQVEGARIGLCGHAVRHGALPSPSASMLPSRRL